VNKYQDRKLLIFDIDGTLCDINQPVNIGLIEVLQNLSKKHQIVLASGKPFGYIAGFMRQLGLSSSIAIGENGGTVNFSASFPPKKYHKINVSNDVQNMFFSIKESFSKEFGNKIWFQPNDVNLTVFPVDITDIKEIHTFAKQFESSSINTYYHKDSVDYTPKGFDKGTAVDILLKELSFSKENLYVFGDGSNDLPMLLKTENSYLINSSLNGLKPKAVFKDYIELEKFLKTSF
jgi:HAD superfamily hydrolase (TIGR01484 family)